MSDQFRLPLAAIRQPAFLYGSDGRITAANDRAEALAGRPLAGCTAADIVAIFGNRHPDGTLFTPEELPPSRALAGEEAIDVPIAVTASDGRTVHVLATASPIRDGGAITGALVVWQDVSTLEAARAEQAALHRESEVRAEGLRARETGLRRHRQLLDAILGALPYRVSLWSRDERLAWANMRFAEDLGEPREALIGRTWGELGDAVAAVEPLVRESQEAITAGMPVSREVEIDGPGGSEWRACTFLPFGRDALLVITGDITERKEAAAELERLTRQIEAERDRLATILDAIPDAISIHDRDDRYVYVNPALMSAARAASGDLLGRSWPERGLDLDRIAPLANAVHDAFASGEPRTAIYECPVDGAVRTYHALAVPLRDAGGAVAQVLVSSRDVTHVLETEAALLEREEWLRLAQESANVAVWDRDVRTGLYTSTPEFFRLYGLEEGRTLSYGQWRERVHPDDVARVETESQAALARGEPFDLEHRVVRPSGEVRWIAATGRGVCDEQGAVVRVLGVNIDITARKAAEEVLAETVEQYRQALNNPLLGYALCEIVTDDAGRPRDFVYLDVNPAFEAFTGLARDRVLNRRVTEILVPAEVAGAIEIYGDVALTGESKTFQYPIPSLGRWYEVAAFSPQRGRFIAFFKDITKRKRAEEALIESEAKYRNLVELAPDAILIHQDGTIVFANPAAAALVDARGPEELLGRPILEIVHPETRGRVEGNVMLDLRGEESPLTTVDILRPDGTTVAVQGRGTMIPHGGRPAVQVVLRDVTEEQRAEAALKRERDFSAGVLSTAAALVVVLDREGRIVRFNEACERISGYAFDEVRGTPFWDLFILPEERRSVRDTFAGLLEDRVHNEHENYWVTRDGDRRLIHWANTVLTDPSGSAEYVISTGIDITEQRRAEAALREYAEDLRRSNEDLERYAYISSHDLQEPLRSIVSFSQLLERRYKGQLGEDADEYIDFIVEGGNRMQSLIQDLLAYSRVNTTRQALRPTETEDVLAAVERHLDLQLREVGAVIAHDPVPEVLADPLQLEQVFANLVSNAIKFRRPDEPLRIHVGARRMNGFWEFSVSDNGIGIEPEYYEKIFVIFQRLHTREKYPGTGIGLAIVKRIIDRHGGTIRVESAPGEGSTFFFTLPAA